MGIIYQKRRLKVNKIKRQIFGTRTLLIRFKLLLSLLLTIALCFLGVKILKSPQWYMDLNKLNLADPSVLKIQGNVITPNHKVINMIRQTQLPYTQIFRLNTKELEQNISQLQPIKKVYVRRHWFPARITVALDERIPAFLLAPNLEAQPHSALTTDGVLIDHDYLPLNPSIKVIKLLTYGVKDGVDVVWDKAKVGEILKLIRAIETYSGQQVQYIDLRNNKDVYIMLKEYLIRFGEINETSLTRVKSIAAILPEAKKIQQKIKYIDLRWEDSSYFRLEGVKEVQKTDVNVQDLKNVKEKSIDNERQEEASEEQRAQNDDILD